MISDTNVASKIGDAIEQSMDVMAANIKALNARDATALAATMHFPHYRLSGGRMKIWPGPENYLSDFYARAGSEWHHSAWESLDVFAAVAN
jgi:hypothetical protein